MRFFLLYFLCFRLLIFLSSLIADLVKCSSKSVSGNFELCVVMDRPELVESFKATGTL